MRVISVAGLAIICLRLQCAWAQVVSHQARKVALASNQFGIDALRALDRIEPPDKVIVFSPICVSASLSMVLMGSSKQRAVSALRHALYVWSMKPQDINRAYRDLLDHVGLNQPGPASATPTVSRPMSRLADANWTQGPALSLPRLLELRQQPQPSEAQHRDEKQPQQTSRREPSPNELVRMNTLSSVYLQRGLHLDYEYNLLLRDSYRTVVHPMDFARNAEETRQHINWLVAATTEGKVRDLMRRQSFEGASPPLRALIVSAFHFRATLELQARPTNGTAGGLIETEPTLLRFGRFARHGLDCTCLEVPFSGRLVSLVVLMPEHANQTDLLLTKLSGRLLADLLGSLSVGQVSLSIPVIKFGRGPTNVGGLLRELALDEAFVGAHPGSGGETGLNRWLRPEDIVHETSIDVGTAVQPPEDRLKVGAHQTKRRRAKVEQLKLDKPFVYFVLDSMNGLALAMGRVRHR